MADPKWVAGPRKKEKKKNDVNFSPLRGKEANFHPLITGLRNLTQVDEKKKDSREHHIACGVINV